MLFKLFAVALAINIIGTLSKSVVRSSSRNSIMMVSGSGSVKKAVVRKRRSSLKGLTLEQTTLSCQYTQVPPGDWSFFPDGYPVGTNGCGGGGACQFKTREEAEEFCSGLSTCKAVSQHPEATQGLDCAWGKGCFLPGQGTNKNNSAWAAGGGITFMKGVCQEPVTCNCINPGAAGHNNYTCTDGTSGSCDSATVCVPTEPFEKNFVFNGNMVCREPCTVTAYEHWPSGMTRTSAVMLAGEEYADFWGPMDTDFITGATDTFTGASSKKWPLENTTLKMSSLRITGLDCTVYAYADPNCNNTANKSHPITSAIGTVASSVSWSSFGFGNDWAQCLEIEKNVWFTMASGAR